MTEHVHHGIKCHGGHCAGHSDVTRKFHHTIGTTSRTKGCSVGKGVARDGEFEGVGKREVFVVVGVVDHDLERPSIEQIDEKPNANHPRKIEEHAVKVLANHFPTFGKLPNHHPDGTKAEDEKDIAIKGFHARGLGGDFSEHSCRKVFVRKTHMEIDNVENGEFDEGINNDEPRQGHSYEKRNVESDGTPIESQRVRPLHQRKTAFAESLYHIGRNFAAITGIQFAFEGLKLRRVLFLSCGVVTVKMEEEFPCELVAPFQFVVLLTEFRGMVEFAAARPFDEIEVDVTVVVGKTALHSMGMEAYVIKHGEDPPAPQRTFVPKRKDGLRHQTIAQGGVDANKPNVARKTIEDTSPKGFLARHARQLTVGRVVEVDPHQQTNANECIRPAPFSKGHKPTRGSTEEDADDGDDIGMDVEIIEELSPEQTDGTCEIDVDIFFSIRALKGRLEIRIFCHNSDYK